MHHETADEHALHVRIREYFLTVARGDRADKRVLNPLFKGRDELVKSIVADARNLIRSSEPAPNLSWVLYGAPGVGKTEMINQLRSRLESLSTNEAPVWVINAGADELTEALAFVQALESQIDRPLMENAKDLQKRGGSFGIAGIIHASIGPDGRRGPRGETARLRVFANELHSGGVRPTIVLLIDEAQRKLRATLKKAGENNFTGPFHEAEIDLKVLPIYAGLGDTTAELARCGVSRPSESLRVHLMERMPDRIIRSIARLALRATTRQGPDVIDRWTERIAGDVQGWPRHLNNALEAVANRAHETDWNLDGNGFENAMEAADLARDDYYNKRLINMRGSLPPEQFTAWAGAFENREFVTSAMLARALNVDADASLELTRNAVRAGLLEERQAGCYIAPTPSLIAHIEKRGHQIDGLSSAQGVERQPDAQVR